MNFFVSTISSIIAPLSMITISDYLQIGVLTTVIYYFLTWLAKDHQKNLLAYFLAYCASGILFYMCGMSILADFYLMTWPMAIFLFISIHQETLQKSFIKIQRYAPLNKANTHWVEEFIKACLIALHKNKEITCVIERFDNLDPVIKTPSKFYADIDTHLVEILLDKHISSDNQFIWMRHDGKIVAINAYFLIHPDDTWVNNDMHHMPQSVIDATYVTSKTDAIVVRVLPFLRRFDVIMQAKLYPNLSAAELSALLPSLFTGSKQAKNPAMGPHAQSRQSQKTI